MKDSLAFTISAVAILALATFSNEVASYPSGGHLAPSPSQDNAPHKGDIIIPADRVEIPSNARSRAMMQLYLLSLLEKMASAPVSSDRIRTKKTCLLNAGLSHSCDYRDAVAAIEEGYYLGSMDTPGRK